MPAKAHDKERRKSKRKKSRLGSSKSRLSSKIAEIQGVVPLKIPTETQKKLGIEIGETLLPDMPWTHILKRDILDDLERQGDHSCFHLVREEITAYPNTHLYIGYDPDIEDEQDMFFLAVTMQAQGIVLNIIQNLEEEQKQRVMDSIWRSIGYWQSLGSEEEIVGTRVQSNRNMIQEEAIINFVPTEDPAFDDITPKDLYHGYIELTNTGMNKKTFTNIIRRCIDVGVQVSPTNTSQEAQTELTYPINMGTQYIYSVDTDTPLVDGPLATNLANFLLYHYNQIEDTLIYNTGIEILINDFDEIILDMRDTKTPSTVVYKELESFIDVDSSKDMVITAVDWHPTMTGMAACAYVEDVRFLPKKHGRKGKEEREDEDIVSRDIYASNVVLIWCFTDGFKPKLCLKSPRPVHYLKFCPYDENVLIGGLINGQIVLWDLKDCIQRVETKEKLTSNQEYHRTAMNNHLQWMKIVRNAAHVTATAVSSVEFSHHQCITSIQWLIPYWVFTSTGHYSHSLTKLNYEDIPMQFLTSSEDGSVDIWDLKVKQQAKAGSYQPKRKWKVRKRLPGLEKSEYLPLNRFIRPHFRIVLEEPKAKNTEQTLPDEEGDISPVYVPFSTMSFQKCPVQYILQEDKKDGSETSIDTMTSENQEGENNTVKNEDTDRQKQFGESQVTSSEVKQERKTFLAIPEVVKDAPERVINVGSVDGRILKFRWQGLVGNLNEVVNFEKGEVKGAGLAIHDGPIVVVQPSPYADDLILTIGGKVFAIWRDDVRDVPMFWKHSPVNVYTGAWSAYRPTMIILIRGDGVLEAWDLSIYSDKPVFVQTLPGKLMTCLVYPFLPFTANILGMGDNNGAFRVYKVPPQHSKSPEIGYTEDITWLENMFKKEKNRKEILKNWANQKKSVPPAHIQKIITEEPGEHKEVSVKESLKADAINLIFEHRCEEFDEEYNQLMQSPSAPIEIIQVFENQWRADREVHMKKIILERLQWDKNAIIEAEEPFRIKREQEEAKQHKIAQRMHQKYHIFEEILKVLFPEMEEKIVHEEESNQKYLEELETIKPHFVQEHDATEHQVLKYIETHPYSRGFDWILLVQEGVKRRKELDIELNNAFIELSNNSTQVKDHPILNTSIEAQQESKEAMYGFQYETRPITQEDEMVDLETNNANEDPEEMEN